MYANLRPQSLVLHSRDSKYGPGNRGSQAIETIAGGSSGSRYCTELHLFPNHDRDIAVATLSDGASGDECPFLVGRVNTAAVHWEDGTVLTDPRMGDEIIGDALDYVVDERPFVHVGLDYDRLDTIETKAVAAYLGIPGCRSYHALSARHRLHLTRKLSGSDAEFLASAAGMVSDLDLLEYVIINGLHGTALAAASRIGLKEDTVRVLRMLNASGTVQQS
ncbi:MAG: hypothetical protein ABH879_10600 [archaeon]